MEGILGTIVMTGLALIALGYTWVFLVGTFVLVSICLVISGAGTLLSSLVISGVSQLRSRWTTRSSTEEVI